MSDNSSSKNINGLHFGDLYTKTQPKEVEKNSDNSGEKSCNLGEDFFRLNDDEHFIIAPS
ncbi:MAG TPA: hypothetical protein VIK86_09075 [Candidatus Paceibacterota bacterium]